MQQGGLRMTLSVSEDSKQLHGSVRKLADPTLLEPQRSSGTIKNGDQSSHGRRLVPSQRAKQLGITSLHSGTNTIPVL